MLKRLALGFATLLALLPFASSTAEAYCSWCGSYGGGWVCVYGNTNTGSACRADSEICGYNPDYCS
jgi:hypothetical protein